MAMPLPDPLAAVSGPISAYMSGHESANLAYVKHFGQKSDAVSATFSSLNSKGFNVKYKTADGSEHDVFIEYNAPVTKREDLRPVLEAMAEEAEAALGMPSSLHGPPPIQALMRAAEIEDAQKQEIKQQQQQEDKDAETSAAIATAAIGNMFGTDETTTPTDVFYPVDRVWQTAVTVGMGTTALLGYGSDDLLGRLFPSFVLGFRDHVLSPETMQAIFRWAVVAHAVEGTVALGICLNRGWYSSINTAKWTGSTFLYGYFSMSKLLAHADKVKKAAKKIE